MFQKIGDTFRHLFNAFHILFKMFTKIRFITKSLLFSNIRSCVTIARMSPNLTKTDAKDMILKAKNESKLTFEEMATKLGQNKVLLNIFVFKLRIVEMIGMAHVCHIR